MLQRLISDPFALALALTAPCLFIVRGYWEWKFEWIFDLPRSGTYYPEYNYAALAINWAVAVIRWKWQKEDKAEQTGR